MYLLPYFTSKLPITVVWRNGGLRASYDSFVVASSVVLRLNISAKNPSLRQSSNRYGKLISLDQNKNHQYGNQFS